MIKQGEDMNMGEELKESNLTEIIDTITLEVSKKIGTITINRVDNLNALRWVEMEKLLELLKEAESIKKVRVVRIRSMGNRVFSAGLDFDMISSFTPEDAPFFLNLGNSIVRQMVKMQKTIVTQVQGQAVGWGCILSLASDFVVVGENPKTIFKLPEIDVGIYPATAALTLALRNLPLRSAKKMLLIPHPYTIDEWDNLGLITERFPLDELDAKTFKFCRNIAKNSMPILNLTKSVMNRIHYHNLEECYRFEAEALELTKYKDFGKFAKFVDKIWDHDTKFEPEEAKGGKTRKKEISE
jgi:enoyl-CoA hydratase/carnithine racemase